MQCDQCNERPAVVHLTQIANDQVVTLHLCERCAAEKGVETSTTLGKTPVGSLVAQMGKGLLGPIEPAALEIACARCGGTFENFREAGRLGCPECYQTFAAPLRELLRRLHGSSRHLGSRYVRPGTAGEAAAGNGGSQAAELDLRERLRRAVEAEDFELAAQLRDQLRGLE